MELQAGTGRRALAWGAAASLMWWVGVAGMAGCGDDAPPGAGEADAAAVDGAGDAWHATDTSTVDTAHAPDSTQKDVTQKDASQKLVHFAHGTMTAGVRTDQAIIWTKTGGPATVQVAYWDDDATPDSATLSPPVQVSGERDYTVELPLTGLAPDTGYSYRVQAVDAQGQTPVAHFRTAPTEDVPFRLAFSADLDPPNHSLKILNDLADCGADLYLSLGDWPCADAVSPHAHSVADYRAKHAEARVDEPVLAWLRAMPVAAVWDDHEALNDWDGANLADDPGQIEAAMRVWHEWFPVQGAPQGEIYRRIPWGPNVDVFLLDTRSHRDANADPNGPDKTMLGAAQRAWLLDGLAASTAAFKLVVSSVPLYFGTTNDDYWAGFVYERDTILDFVTDQQIGGVVFLTGDQHWLAVHHLPQGMKELQACPLARHLREPDTDVPWWVVTQQKVFNYGTLDYAPATASAPPTLTFRGWADGGEELYSEVIQAGRGEIEVQADPATSWRLTGAHRFEGTGDTVLPWATPGTYTVEWLPAVPDPAGPPAPDTQTLADGQAITFVAPPPSGPTPTFFDGFDADEDLSATWTVVDQGEGDTTSDWHLDAGAVVETGNCYDVDKDEATVEKRGTFLWAQGVSWPAGSLTTRAYAGDNDGFGLMYGIADEQTYYRVGLDNQRSFARLVRVDAGVFTVLAEDLSYAPPLSTWITLTVERDGPTHRVLVDGAVILEATEAGAPLAAGSIGLYSYGMDDLRFDYVAAYEGP